MKTLEKEIAALCHRRFFALTKALYFQPSSTAHCLFLSVQMSEICNKCADVLGSKHSRHKWLPIQLWPTSSAVRTEWGLAAQMYVHISWKAERYILALSTIAASIYWLSQMVWYLYLLCSVDYWCVLHYIKTLWTWQTIQLYSLIILSEPSTLGGRTREHQEGFLRPRQSIV